MTRLIVLLKRPRRGPDGEPTTELLGRCDAAALRAALALRGRRSELTVTALALGPADRDDAALHLALFAGADRAVRIWDDALEGLDYHAVAQVLSTAARWLGFELILGGDRSEDEGAGAVGPAVAEALGVPHVSATLDVALAGGAAFVTRRDAGHIVALRIALPALVTVVASAAPEPTLADRGQAIDVVDLQALGLRAPELWPRQLGQSTTSLAPRTGTVLGSPDELITRLRQDRLIDP